MSPTRERLASNPERLAYWYFRVNGFLTTENFIVHPYTGQEQRTDADLLAVRFEHRAENLTRPMKDDPKVVCCETFANIIIAEVKTGPCALNGPWTNPQAGNLKRVLKAVGCVPHGAIDLACDSLHKRGVWSDPLVTIRLFAVGESYVDTLLISQNQQLTWEEIISFCVRRFAAYQREKSSVGQWTEDGRQLKEDATDTSPEARIRRSFALRPKHDIARGV